MTLLSGRIIFSSKENNHRENYAIQEPVKLRKCRGSCGLK